MPVNFKVVEPGILYRCGAIYPGELKMLSGPQYKVKKIISLDVTEAKKIAPYVKQYNIEHIILPVSYTGSVRSISDFIYNNARSLFKSDGAIIVHCRRGIDRTGFVVALYRVIIRGWDCNRAIAEATSYGYGSGIPVDIKNQFNSVLCKACRASHKHFCQKNIKVTASDRDIVDKLETQLYLKPSPTTLSQPPITNTPEQMTELTVSPQQSFAPFTGESGENGSPGSKTDISNTDDRLNARRNSRKKLILKLLNKKEFGEKPIGVGYRDNYNGTSDTYLNAPSGTPGSPISSGPVEPSGTLQLW